MTKITNIIYKGNTTPREFNRFPLRLMIALWLLSMVVIINAYIGTFIAQLAVTKLERTVDTLEDLAASKTLKMAVERTSDMKMKAMVYIHSLTCNAKKVE